MKKLKNNDKLTLLCFKDETTPRAYEFSLLKLKKIIYIAIFLALLFVSALFYGSHYYWNRIATDSRPNYKMSIPPTVIEEEETSSIERTNPPNSEKAPEAISEEIIEEADNNTPKKVYSLLPEKVARYIEPMDKTLILENVTTTWKGAFITVHFNLKYTKEDGGSQQGKIIILAKGPSTLFVYPKNAFQPFAKGYLIEPDEGEFYSLKRLRNTQATIGPTSSKEEIDTIRILIFSLDYKLIIDKIINLKDKK